VHGSAAATVTVSLAPAAPAARLVELTGVPEKGAPGGKTMLTPSSMCVTTDSAGAHPARVLLAPPPPPPPPSSARRARGATLAHPGAFMGWSIDTGV